MEENRDRNNKIGNLFSIVVLIMAVIIAVGFATAGSYTIWIIAIANLVCGPVCLAMYLIEVKKGVFRDMGQ